MSRERIDRYSEELKRLDELVLACCFEEARDGQARLHRELVLERERQGERVHRRVERHLWLACRSRNGLFDRNRHLYYAIHLLAYPKSTMLDGMKHT